MTDEHPAILTDGTTTEASSPDTAPVPVVRTFKARRRQADESHVKRTALLTPSLQLNDSAVELLIRDIDEAHRVGLIGDISRMVDDQVAAGAKEPQIVRGIKEMIEGARDASRPECDCGR